MNYLRMIATTRRHPCAVLLGIQLLGILAYPFAESTPAGQMALARVLANEMPGLRPQRHDVAPELAPAEAGARA